MEQAVDKYEAFRVLTIDISKLFECIWQNISISKL